MFVPQYNTNEEYIKNISFKFIHSIYNQYLKLHKNLKIPIGSKWFTNMQYMST